MGQFLAKSIDKALWRIGRTCGSRCKKYRLIRRKIRYMGGFTADTLTYVAYALTYVIVVDALTKTLSQLDALTNPINQEFVYII